MVITGRMQRLPTGVATATTMVAQVASVEKKDMNTSFIDAGNFYTLPSGGGGRGVTVMTEDPVFSQHVEQEPAAVLAKSRWSDDEAFRRSRRQPHGLLFGNVRHAQWVPSATNPFLVTK
jgi:hypothetical protein